MKRAAQLILLRSVHRNVNCPGDPGRSRDRAPGSCPGFCLPAVLLHEALNTSRRIKELLLAGEKRMTVRAYFNFQKLAGLRRPCLECISTHASNRYRVVLRMNSASHLFSYLHIKLQKQPTSSKLSDGTLISQCRGDLRCGPAKPYPEPPMRCRMSTKRFRPNNRRLIAGTIVTLGRFIQSTTT